MKIRFLLCTGLLLASVAPLLAAKAGKASKTVNQSQPSVTLRSLIDATMPRISTLKDSPKKANDRQALAAAQADFLVKQKTLPPNDQPIYQAAAETVGILIAAVDEHDKAAANFRYSQSVRGVQDTKDTVVSNTQRGVGSGLTAKANDRKEKRANEDSRKELLQKQAFMSEGANNAWKVRLGQFQAAVEKSYTAALLAEKQAVAARPETVAAVQPPTPEPKAAPAPARKRKARAAEQYSPVGTWSIGDSSWVFKEDGTFMAVKTGGQWKWKDQSKGELELKWDKGRTTAGTFSADGQTLDVVGPAGKRTDTLKR